MMGTPGRDSIIPVIENPIIFGMISGMRSTIDSAGRLVLPKPVREAANLEGGAEVEIRFVGDHLEIEPVPTEVSMIEKDGFVVAIPKKSHVPKLTAEDVQTVRTQIEKERERFTGAK